ENGHREPPPDDRSGSGRQPGITCRGPCQSAAIDNGCPPAPRLPVRLIRITIAGRDAERRRSSMTSEERGPFEIHGSGWYEKPLDYKVVIYEPDHESHVAKITMNRPERLNALSHELRAELFHALKVAERDNDINVIVIKGAGRAFSAGYDLAGGNIGVQEPDFGSQYVGGSHWARYLINQYWQIWELSKVVIAQTHGYVLAGAS